MKRRIGMHQATLPLALLLFALTVVLLGQTAPPVHAAGVTEQITVTMAPTLSASQTITLSSSCMSSGSNSTFIANGNLKTYTANSNNCPITLTAPAATATNRWVFALGTCTGAEGSTAYTSCSYTTGANGDTISIHLYFQDIMTCKYAVVGGPPTAAPACAGTFLGSSATLATATTAGATIYPDAGSSVTMTPNPLSGSGAVQRWETNAATSVPAVGGGIISPVYYEQYGYFVSYSVVGSGTPTTPTFSYTEFGSAKGAALTSASTEYWLDASSACLVTNPLPGSSSTERWDTAVACPAVGAPQSLAFAFYHQYLVTSSFSVTGGGAGYGAPSLWCSSFGGVSPSALAQNPRSLWCDGGDNWFVTNPLPGGNSTQRWYSNQATSGTVTGASTTSFDYFHQYLMTFAYEVAGGGSGYTPPTVTFYQYGKAVNGTSGWADAGSSYSYTDPLAGSTQTERWSSGSAQGTVASAASVDLVYFHQFAFTLGYDLLGGGTGYQPPMLLSTSFGSVTVGSLGTAPSLRWLDAGTQWSAPALLAGSSSSERWKTFNETSGPVGSPYSLQLDYFHQYLLQISYAVVGGGTPPSPQLAFVNHGSGNGTTLSTARFVFWGDAGSVWSLPQLLPTSSSVERWVANGAHASDVGAPATVNVDYLHQYFITTDVNVAGGEIANQTGWSDSGANVSLRATSFLGWQFEYWKGSGTGSYNGSSPTATASADGAVSEVAVFYPGLTINPGSQGSVAYSYGSTAGNTSLGTELVIYVPPGSNVTLRAIPSNPAIVFQGWSEGARGADSSVSVDVRSPVSVAASFGPDYTDIQILAASLLVIAFLAAYTFLVRRKGE